MTCGRNAGVGMGIFYDGEIDFDREVMVNFTRTDLIFETVKERGLVGGGGERTKRDSERRER